MGGGGAGELFCHGSKNVIPPLPPPSPQGLYLKRKEALSSFKHFGLSETDKVENIALKIDKVMFMLKPLGRYIAAEGQFVPKDIFNPVSRRCSVDSL